MIIITREYLISLLEAWRNDLITAKQLYECIEILYDASKICLDEEGEEEDSVCLEVIGLLDMMDMNYTWKDYIDAYIEDDIDAYIELLKTPTGQFKEGVKKIRDYIDSVDIKERKKKLCNIEPYN